MRTATVTAAAALLAGCGGGESGAPAGEPSAATAGSPSAGVATGQASPPAAGVSHPAPAAAPVLTADGYGPARIGMTRAELVAALGEDSNPEAVGGPDPESCDEFFPARAPNGLLVMIEAGRLTRISLVRDAAVTTNRELGLGATAAQVRAAYGTALRTEPHKYEGAPAEYLTVWLKDAPKDDRSAVPASARGILYEIGAKGTVQRISAGGPSVQYVEGCA